MFQTHHLGHDRVPFLMVDFLSSRGYYHFLELIRKAGFEPATPWFQTKYSDQTELLPVNPLAGVILIKKCARKVLDAHKKPYIVIISHSSSKCNKITHKTPKTFFCNATTEPPKGVVAPGGDALGGVGSWVG